MAKKCGARFWFVNEINSRPGRVRGVRLLKILNYPTLLDRTIKHPLRRVFLCL
ncbi:hypothetical protein HOE425_331162 [Hoeflea sp. EC-HK425]|nr:hypothetical protein HOE425_331162 [Hoeflea sp. EC-HK425]